MLQTILCLFLIPASLLVSIASNPIESVIWLICAFIDTAFILFFFNVEFLALIFVIVYVGAIAVLFLFVIMMLNIKMQKAPALGYNNVIKLFLKCSLIYVIFLMLFFLFEKIFYNENFFYTAEVEIAVFSMDPIHNISVLSQVLYNFFSSCFLVAGLILLLALLGAIILTLNFSVASKGQIIVKQQSVSSSNRLFNLIVCDADRSWYEWAGQTGEALYSNPYYFYPIAAATTVAVGYVVIYVAAPILVDYFNRGGNPGGSGSGPSAVDALTEKSVTTLNETLITKHSSVVYEVFGNRDFGIERFDTGPLLKLCEDKFTLEVFKTAFKGASDCLAPQTGEKLYTALYDYFLYVATHGGIGPDESVFVFFTSRGLSEAEFVIANQCLRATLKICFGL